MNATGEFYTLQPQDAPHEMEELGGLLAANNLRLDSRGIRGLPAPRTRRRLCRSGPPAARQ
jgi:hypothetical protein